MKNKSPKFWIGFATVVSGAFIFWMSSGTGQIPPDRLAEQEIVCLNPLCTDMPIAVTREIKQTSLQSEDSQFPPPVNYDPFPVTPITHGTPPVHAVSPQSTAAAPKVDPFAMSMSTTEAPAISDASSIADDSIVIRYSFGPGGPVRPNKKFYPEEAMFFFLELPSKFVVDNTFDFELRGFLIFGTEPDIPRNPAHFSGHLTKVQSSLTMSARYRIPSNIKAGEYEFQLEIYDRLNNKKFIKKDTVEILDASNFGMRSIGLWRGVGGTESAVPGSGYFSAGELAAITFTVGGLTIDNEGKVKTFVEAILIDESNQRVDISVQSQNIFMSNATNVDEFVPRNEKLFFGNDFFQTWDFHLNLQLTQPGSYRLKVAVQDLNSGEVSGYILPVFVKAPSLAQPISSVMGEDTQWGTSKNRFFASFA